MTAFVRLGTVAILITGAATLSACSIFSSQAVECGGEVETRLVGEVLLTSGVPAAVLIGADVNNNPAAAALLLAATAASIGDGALRDQAQVDPDRLATSIKRVKAMQAGGGSSFDAKAVITKEKKSKRSVVCSAQVNFAAQPPADYPKSEQSSAVWNRGAQTYWQVEYTAELTDKGDEVYVAIKDSTCGGPGCKAAEALATLGLLLQGEKGDELLRLMTAATTSVPQFTLRTTLTFGELTDDDTALLRDSPAADLISDGAAIVRTDLDGDATDELIVQATSSSNCGSGGCATVVLKKTADGFEVLLEQHLFPGIGVTNERVGPYQALCAVDDNKIVLGEKAGTPLFGKQMVYPLK